MDDIYKDYYHQTAPLFDTIRLDKEVEIAGTANIVQSFVKKEKATILDIGCGTGRYSAHLQRLGYGVIGIDISPEQLQYAPSSLSLICGSATDLPFEDNSFACCLMVLVQQQLDSEQRSKAIYESHRVLQEDGILAIKTRSHEDIYKYPFKEVFPSAIPINLQRYPAVPLLTRELETAGFKGINTIPTFS